MASFRFARLSKAQGEEIRDLFESIAAGSCAMGLHAITEGIDAEYGLGRPSHEGLRSWLRRAYPKTFHRWSESLR